jgi:benzoate-CoA ligase family protein
MAGSLTTESAAFSYADVPDRFNLTAYFLERQVVEGSGDRPALHCGADTYSYRQLLDLTNQVGNTLHGLGVEREDRILLALNDGIEFVATWYAALKIGAIVGEVYTFLQPKDYEYYLRYSRAKVAVVDATTHGQIRQISANCPDLKHILVVGNSRPKGNEVAFDDLVANSSTQLSTADTSRDDIALWKFTTGSTGAPKAAVHCHHDPLISFELYARGVLDYRLDDVVLPIPKLFFGYARDAATLFTFGVGASAVVFPERSTPERVFELIRRHRPTILVQVPTMINAMAEHPDAAKQDLSSLRYCISSGEALPSELYQKWKDRFGIELLDGIGSSELYHIYISNRPGNVRPGSVGQLVPGYEAAVVRADGQPVQPGEAGELWVKGDSAALMYWNDYQKSRRTFVGEWVHTGDVVRCDEEGFFWYVARVDSLLKVGGIWVAPLEVEDCLLRHPAVRDCAVVAYSDAGLALPRATIVLQAGRKPSAGLAKELQEFVRANLSPHKFPRDVRFVEALPRTPSGKIDRRALSE